MPAWIKGAKSWQEQQDWYWSRATSGPGVSRGKTRRLWLHKNQTHQTELWWWWWWVERRCWSWLVRAVVACLEGRRVVNLPQDSNHYTIQQASAVENWADDEWLWLTENILHPRRSVSQAHPIYEAWPLPHNKTLIWWYPAEWTANSKEPTKKQIAATEPSCELRRLNHMVGRERGKLEGVFHLGVVHFHIIFMF